MAARKQPPSELLTFPEVADILRVSLRTVQRMDQRGELPVVRIRNGAGRSLPRVRPEDLHGVVEAVQAARARQRRRR
jgi:excisionase family DNA binding protein